MRRVRCPAIVAIGEAFNVVAIGTNGDGASVSLDREMLVPDQSAGGFAGVIDVSADLQPGVG